MERVEKEARNPVLRGVRRLVRLKFQIPYGRHPVSDGSFSCEYVKMTTRACTLRRDMRLRFPESTRRHASRTWVVLDFLDSRASHFSSTNINMGADLFDVAVATIFAREFMEGAIIIGEFRTVIQRSESEASNGLTKAEMLRAVNVWAAIGALVAVLVVVIVAIPLAVLSKNFDDKTADIIEGISKVIAAFAILTLSLKIPRWLGFYKNKKKGKVSDDFDLSMRSIRFNVAWNIWREVAECGVFLLPSFLKGDDA